MTAHPAPDLLTIAPENIWIKVEGRCIGPITAPLGSPDFAAEFRRLAGQITGKPAPALRALAVGELWELEQDMGHVGKLLELAQGAMENVNTQAGRDELDALLWILRDRAEILTWKAGELAKVYTRKDAAQVAS